jgi:hypothetical protein
MADQMSDETCCVADDRSELASSNHKCRAASRSPGAQDTLNFWREPLAEARAHKRLSDPNRAEIEGLVAGLQALVAAHQGA